MYWFCGFDGWWRCGDGWHWVAPDGLSAHFGIVDLYGLALILRLKWGYSSLDGDFFSGLALELFVVAPDQVWYLLSV